MAIPPINSGVPSSNQGLSPLSSALSPNFNKMLNLVLSNSLASLPAQQQSPVMPAIPSMAPLQIPSRSSRSLSGGLGNPQKPKSHKKAKTIKQVIPGVAECENQVSLAKCRIELVAEKNKNLLTEILRLEKVVGRKITQDQQNKEQPNSECPHLRERILETQKNAVLRDENLRLKNEESQKIREYATIIQDLMQELSQQLTQNEASLIELRASQRKIVEQQQRLNALQEHEKKREDAIKLVTSSNDLRQKIIAQQHGSGEVGVLQSDQVRFPELLYTSPSILPPFNFNLKSP